jgi:ATP-binding cassette subfamily C protein
MNERSLRGNELFRLDDARAVWVVERGGLALFRVASIAGELHGARRFLFSCGEGDLLFGLPFAESSHRQEVVAVALEPTVLRRLETPPDEAAVERWKNYWRLSHVAFEWPTAAEPPALYHAALIRRIEELRSRDDREELSRIQERERRSQETVSHALTELTSVLARRPAEVGGGTGLFAAAGVVGKALGIAIRRPASWEEEAGDIDRVEAMARASRVRVRKVVLHDSWWKQDCGPLLAFRREDNRPVAVLPRAGGGYLLFDPESGGRSEMSEALASTMSPEGYVFYRPLPQHASRGAALFKFALSGRGRDFLVILATATAATLLGMLSPQATAILVDHAIPDADLNMLRHIGLGLLAAAFGIAVFRWSQGIAMMRVETSADAVTQSAVWDRLLNLQVSFFRKFSTGDLQSRVTAVSQIRSYLGGTTLRTLFSSVILLLNLALLLYYSPSLTILAVVVAALSCAATVITGIMILRYSRKVLDLKGSFFGLMVQLINGVAKLRVAAAEERAFARWAQEYSRLLKLELKQKRIQDAVRVINIAISTVSTIALFSIAAVLIGGSVGGASLSTGTFLAFNIAYGTFIGAIANLSNTVTDVMAIAILRERARPILEATPEVGERKADPGRLTGRLELDHLVFQYHDDGPVILDDVSMRIEPSSFVALVGPSGSGKSTLFRLLLGFESPQSGRIYYDGQDLAGLDVYAIRRQMSVVLQNGRINAGSIFENIVTGTRLTLNQAWEAAQAAGFEDEIKAMPMGMHTIISEGGTNLSGGQRQRLLLTRALVHRPKILLLDEATSALDNKTQRIVSESLQKLRVTRVVIAHRLSTVRNADRIYVIQGGRIVQKGGFAELAAREGLFRWLMARQMA